MVNKCPSLVHADVLTLSTFFQMENGKALLLCRSTSLQILADHTQVSAQSKTLAGIHSFDQASI